MNKFLKRNFALILICITLCCISLFYCLPVNVWTNRHNGVTIVLDAGHGGRDGGCIGENGTIEKEINLEYVLALKEKLVDAGYSVVLTRKTGDGLYSEFAVNKKISDMNTRMEIIKKANPNLVISIHMNSFSDSSVKGANCFYKLGDDSSKRCADLIQECLNVYCVFLRYQSLREFLPIQGGACHQARSLIPYPLSLQALR